jgi:cytidine deaminase
MNLPEYVERLLAAARKASTQAYAPYSKFHVGAALLLPDDRIIVGCNVENASFGMTICAERNAALHAVVEGYRTWNAIVIVSPTGVSPCGACRQFLSEFESKLEIWYGYLDASKPVHGPITLDKLLPNAMSFPT